MTKECPQRGRIRPNEKNVIYDEARLQEYWCLFLRDRRWSIKQKRALLSHFKCVSKILNASCAQTNEIVKSKPKNTVSAIDPMQIHDDLKWLSLPYNELITIQDSRYPKVLLELPDPPLALFTSGDLRLLGDPAVAIVGSRRPTPIGAKVAKDISSGLARLGIVIVSGMALGIDGLVHQAARDVDGGTIAVMGCGLDVVYPVRNTGLYAQIKSKGLLVSEFTLGTRPTKYTFPMRNRIVSGLAYGVVIVEAAKKSGTLITASFANEQNKEVMVVPGSVLSTQYAGSHELISNGAALISSYQNVLECLSGPLSHVILRTTEKSSEKSEQSTKHPILQFIGAESTSVDAIVLSSGLTTADVSSILLDLELNGFVAATQEGGYINLS